MKTLPLLLGAQALLASGALAGPLHDAAKDGDTAAIAAALDAGEGVNDSDAMAPPLFHAARRGHVEAAELLLARGADVNAPSKLGPPVIAAASAASAELLDLLLAKGADPNVVQAGASPLNLAVKKKCLACVEALVEAGADVNWRNADGATALHIARTVGYAEVDAYLISHGAAPPAAAPVSPHLASADVERGGKLFISNCQGCHSIEADGKAKQGPPLWGVVGRDRASYPGVDYSAALSAWEGRWTFEDLNVFLLAPMAAVPGVKMNMPGLPDDADRVNLIAYLRTQSDAPVPLP
jgi:cytochrome c